MFEKKLLFKYLIPDNACNVLGSKAAVIGIGEKTVTVVRFTPYIPINADTCYVSGCYNREAVKNNVDNKPLDLIAIVNADGSLDLRETEKCFTPISQVINEKFDFYPDVLVVNDGRIYSCNESEKRYGDLLGLLQFVNTRYKGKEKIWNNPYKTRVFKFKS